MCAVWHNLGNQTPGNRPAAVELASKPGTVFPSAGTSPESEEPLVQSLQTLEAMLLVKASYNFYILELGNTSFKGSDCIVKSDLTIWKHLCDNMAYEHLISFGTVTTEGLLLLGHPSCFKKESVCSYWHLRLGGISWKCALKFKTWEFGLHMKTFRWQLTRCRDNNFSFLWVRLVLILIG